MAADQDLLYFKRDKPLIKPYRMKSDKEIQDLNYSDQHISSYLESLKNRAADPYHLLILAGPYKKAREPFLSDLQKAVGELSYVDLREIVGPVEEQTYKNIDALFDSLGDTEQNLCFLNGDVLCGEYTAYSYSAVRYATPQERYLLRKIAASDRLFILDLNDPDNIDPTLKRHSHAIIRFNGPSSFFDRLKWKLGQIHVHGHTFTNKRPSILPGHTTAKQ